MKKKDATTKTKIRSKPLPSLPKNLTNAGYRHIAAILEDLRLHFRPVIESQKMLVESINNLCDRMIQWRKEDERLDEILSCPATRKKFLEEYRLHGRVSIFDFPLHEKENATK